MRICLLSGHWILFLERQCILVQKMKRINFDLDAAVLLEMLITEPPSSLADGKVRSQSY